MIISEPIISKINAKTLLLWIFSFKRRKARIVTNTGLQLNNTATTDAFVVKIASWYKHILITMPRSPKNAKYNKSFFERYFCFLWSETIAKGRRNNPQ